MAYIAVRLRVECVPNDEADPPFTIRIFFLIMDVIVRILQLAHAHSRFCLRIDNPPYLPLVIEDIGRNGPRGMRCISVAHYAETSGVLRCRPEMLFEIRQRNFSLSLAPFYFRDDDQHTEGYSVFWTGHIIVVDGEYLKEQEKYAADWNHRLEEQQFEAAFRRKISQAKCLAK